jgi:hypothetical protein
MRFFLFSLILISFIACNSDDQVPTDPYMGYSYVPLENGTDKVFYMDSIVFGTDASGFFRDTTTYYLRERIEEYVEFNDRFLYAVDQYKSEDPNGPWTFYKRVYDLNEVNSYRRIDDNLELVYFSFPPYLGKSWETTALINNSVGVPIGTNYVKVFDKWTNTFIIDFYEQYDLEGTMVDSVYHVEYVNLDDVNINFAEVRFEEHFYANNIGLIRRNTQIMDSQYSGLDPLNYLDFIEAGYILEQRLIYP